MEARCCVSLSTMHTALTHCINKHRQHLQAHKKREHRPPVFGPGDPAVEAAFLPTFSTILSIYALCMLRVQRKSQQYNNQLGEEEKRLEDKIHRGMSIIVYLSLCILTTEILALTQGSSAIASVPVWPVIPSSLDTRQTSLWCIFLLYFREPLSTSQS